MPKSADAPIPFVATLQEINGGASLLELSDLSDALIAVVDAVRRTGKKGSLTYTLTVKPASAGDVDTLFLADDVKLKMPSLRSASRRSCSPTPTTSSPGPIPVNPSSPASRRSPTWPRSRKRSSSDE